MVTIICKKLLHGLTAAGCDAVPGLAPNGPVSCLISCLVTRKHQRSHFIRHQRCYSQVGGGKESGLLAMLKDGGNVVIAEGYLWELERRGFLQFGRYGPEVVLDHPSVLKSLHEEFAHAGSDVIEAFTYYGYRERLKHFGREDEVENLNRSALRLAREVADDNEKLMAGSLSNTPLYEENNQEMANKITDMFREQIEWAVEEKADYIIGETFDAYGEAKLALDAIQKYGAGLPAVITITAYVPNRTVDEVPIAEACRRLEEAGAAVVGINCGRGPSSMMPLLHEIREACEGPIAALPVPYRTRPECKTFQAVTDPITGENLYPENLDAVRNSRADIRKFAEEAKELGVQYIGLCCGNAPILTREVAEVYGRDPPASKYKMDMSMSFVFGETSKDYKTDKLRKFMIGEIQ